MTKPKPRKYLDVLSRAAWQDLERQLLGSWSSAQRLYPALKLETNTSNRQIVSITGFYEFVGETDWATPRVELHETNKPQGHQSAKERHRRSLHFAIQNEMQALFIFLYQACRASSKGGGPYNYHAHYLVGWSTHRSGPAGHRPDETSAYELFSLVLARFNEDDRNTRKRFDRFKLSLWLQMIYFLTQHMEMNLRKWWESETQLSLLANGSEPLTGSTPSAQDVSQNAVHLLSKQTKPSSRVTEDGADWFFLAPTDRIHVYVPQRSPFSPQDQALFIRVQAWRDDLDYWLAHLADTPLTSQTWMAGMVMSSMIVGGLIDEAKVKDFIAILCTQTHPPHHPDLHFDDPYLEFIRRMGHNEDDHLQRWLIDPITEMLWYRRPAQQIPAPTKTELIKWIGQLLSSSRRLRESENRNNTPVSNWSTPSVENAGPQSLRHLVQCVRAAWYTQAPTIDLKVMERQVVSHSLHTRTWRRFFEKSSGQSRPSNAITSANLSTAQSGIRAWRTKSRVFVNPDEMQGHAPHQHLHTAANDELPLDTDVADTPEGLGATEFNETPDLPISQDPVDDQAVDHPWISQMMQALDKPSRTPITPILEALSELQSKQAIPKAHQVYVEWIEHLLSKSQSYARSLKLTTIKRYASLVIPQLVMRLNEEDIRDFEQDDFQDLYREISEEAPYFVQHHTRHLAKGLREFHRYLEKHHGCPKIKDITGTFGEEAGLEPVDANPISVDEYLQARQQLRKKIIRRTPNPIEYKKVEIEQIVMMMAFRLGMRRQEIFGLQVRDIACFDNLELLIRPNETRRLKTRASRRVSLASIFLPPDERDQLRDWLKQSQGRAPAALVFDIPVGEGRWERCSHEQTSERIIQALKEVVGPHSKIHQLRHSFACWTYLALRAPDHPQVLGFFKHLPKTHEHLLRGSQLRKDLFNHQAPVSRNYAHAVASLLGHSSPLVSQFSYIHINDFIYYSLGCRAANTLSKQALIGVSGKSSSVVYRYQDRAAEKLAKLVRKKHKSVFLPAPTGAHRPGQTSSTENTNLPARQLTHRRSDHLSDAQTIQKKSIRIKLPVQDTPQSPTSAHAQDLWACLNLLHEASTRLLTRSQGSTQDLPIALDRVEDPYVWIAQATHLTRELDLSRLFNKAHPPIPFWLPQLGQKQREKHWENTLSQRILQALKIDKDLCLEGARVCLLHHNPSKSDVVFKNASETEELKCFLEWLTLLEIPPQQVKVLLRQAPSQESTSMTRKPKLPAWAQPHLKPWKKSPVLLVAPPVRRFEKAYASWVGIKLLDEEGQAYPLITCALAYLCLVLHGAKPT